MRLRSVLALALLASAFVVPATGSTRSCQSVAGNLVSNCSFETPVVGAGGDSAPGPGSSIGAWTVSQGGDAVDLTDRRFDTQYPVSDGDQSLDLNRDNPGGVEQPLATQAGAGYHMTFDMSGFPAKAAPCTATNPQRVRVSAGSSTQEFTFAPNPQANPPGNQRFESHTFDFVAAGNDVLRLHGVNAGCTGPIIDNVVVTPSSVPAPVLGKSMTALAISGSVLVELPGSHHFKRISSFTSLRVGTIVDVRHGRVRLTATSGGHTYTADFYEGEFQILQQARTGATADLKLFGGSFKGCPPAARIAKKKGIRHLWGSGSGPFRTLGRFAAATVRGTTWDTEDDCTGTLVKVTAGQVLVRDFVKRKNIVVSAGHQYFAAARGH